MKQFLFLIQQNDTILSEDSIEEQEVLCPKSLLPPNQIIKKRYDLDIKPNMKLLSSTNKDNDDINFLGSQVNLNKSRTFYSQYNYNVEFEEDDTLGYEYYEKIRSQNLVYLKFDNSKYMSCPEDSKKYMAGCFIPLSELLKPQLRQSKNLYNVLNSSSKFPVVDYKFNIQNSFGENCFSKDNQLKFSSNYEGSNLFMAIKKGNQQYDLILQNDTNSKGTTQWFNFAITIFKEGTYKFNIVNLTKSHSLFQKGMLIPYFSFQNKLLNNTSWSRGCTNIIYQKNLVMRQGNGQNPYYKLHFEYQSPHKYDTVVFSYCFPYSSIQAQKFFNKITYKKSSTLFKVQKIKICETVSGLPLYVYQISQKRAPIPSNSSNNIPFGNNLNANDFRQNQKIFSSVQKQFKSIVFMARQHPGQSQSSYILQGIMEFLIQNNEYDVSKKNFCYYVIPIVNVDGVYYGNYRTNLSGNDLNRIWKQPRKDFHAEIYYIKKYLLNINKITPIKLIIDIHGHSSAFNSFFYGNPVKKQNLNQPTNPKLFPYFCSKNMKQISFLQSTFKISQDKKNSARVVLNQMFPKALVYTLQNSFFGYKKGKKIVQYTPQKYRKLGRSLMASYLQFTKINERNPSIKQKWMKQIEQINNIKKTQNIQIFSESDSQADKQLIELQQQFQKIQQININSNNTIEDKTAPLRQRSVNNMRFLYSKSLLNSRTNKVRNRSSSKQKQFRGIHLDLNSQSQSDMNIFCPQGFLSIIKIQTKKSPIQSKQKLSVSQVDPIQQKQQTEQKQNSVPLSKTLHLTPQKDSPPIKQFRYINEKQYLLKKRKKINNNNLYLLNQFVDSKNYLKASGLMSMNKSGIKN